MDVAVAALSGLLAVGWFAVFVIALYRLAGIHPSAMERRRLAVQFAGLSVIATGLSVISALDVPPGLGAYTLGCALAVFLGLRYLQQKHHWLATLTAEERAILPARRQALAAVRRRPAFWILGISFVVLFPVLFLALVIALR